MKFTCILYTNTFLVGRNWDFKPSLAIRDVRNSKNGQNRGSSNNKVPTKERHDT